ncbi:MaoC family dehydratase [Paraburkholderia dipogonis]|uniref:MaoC family dehydratase n=1 Tax=Paraburkholderia dipogonis TaxID=1211383 RepID=A0ABW9B073_9BURK
MNSRVSGKYFEELNAGNVYKHAITRTVTETDNLLFSALTHNTQPLHLDEEFCKQSIYGTRIVNSCFTLGLITGVSVNDLTLGTTLGNLGYEEISFTKPVLIGDTLYAETEIIEKRESKSRPNAGIVKFEHRGFNQRGEMVCKIVRTGLMSKRPPNVSSNAAGN